jgi:hypothetical protein
MAGLICRLKVGKLLQSLAPVAMPAFRLKNSYLFVLALFFMFQRAQNQTSGLNLRIYQDRNPCPICRQMGTFKMHDYQIAMNWRGWMSAIGDAIMTSSDCLMVVNLPFTDGLGAAADIKSSPVAKDSD